MPTDPYVGWSGSDLDVTTIERRLAGLWSEITAQTGLTHASRARIFNLVAFAGDDESAERISGTLEHLAQRHPSRAILLIGDRLGAADRIDAQLEVRCQSSPALGRLLCREKVQISAHGRPADHLAGVVIPLLIPGLPTYLWWPGQPPFGYRMFNRLLSVADQLVIDSTQFQSPGDGFAHLLLLCRGRQGVNDFNWGRLKPWRDVIAQFFDAPAWVLYAGAIRTVRVEFGAGGEDYPRITAGTLLLLGWLASHLGWEPDTTLDGLATADLTLAAVQGGRRIPIHLQFCEHGRQAAGRLMRVELVSQPREESPARFTVERTSDLQHARVTVEIHGGCDISRVVPLDLKNDAELLIDELEMAGHDTLYERVVEMASRLAGRELWVPV